MQPDLGDIRLLQYLFEHNWRWLLHDPLHPDLWQAPFFYPADNVGAYSDTLLALLPFYAPWRLLGMAPDSALQAASMAIFAANFAIAYRLLRQTLGFSAHAALAGAFVFSFAALRSARLGHLQLCGQFYSLLVIDAIIRALANTLPLRARRWAVVQLFGALLAQLYAGFYLTWFLLFGLVIAALLAMVRAHWRAPLMAAVRALWRELLIFGALALLLATPLLLHAWSAAQAVGFRSAGEVLGALPRPSSFLFSGRENWLLGQWNWMRGLAAGVPLAHEQRLYPGALLFTVAAVGWVIARRDTVMQIIGLSVVVMLLLALYLPTWDFSLWRWVYQWVPGANAIRAVARVGLIMLLPLALGVAWAVAAAERQRRLWCVALLAAGFCVEQLTVSPRFDKAATRALEAQVAAAVSPACGAFYLQSQVQRPAYAVQLDAMLAALKIGIPTLNGYSGNAPPGWDLGDPASASVAAIDAWAQRMKIQQPVCIVMLTAGANGVVTVRPVR